MGRKEEGRINGGAGDTTYPRESALQDIRLHVAGVDVDEGDGGVLAREMLEDEGGHGGAVVGAGDDAVVVLESEVGEVDCGFAAGGEDGDDARVWGAGEEGLGVGEMERLVVGGAVVRGGGVRGMEGGVSVGFERK